MRKNNLTEGQLADWLTVQRQARRDGLLKDWQIADLDDMGVSWVDYNSSPKKYRRGVAARLEELGIDDGPKLVKRNRELIARLQAQSWEPFAVAEAAVAGQLD